MWEAGLKCCLLVSPGRVLYVRPCSKGRARLFPSRDFEAPFWELLLPRDFKHVQIRIQKRNCDQTGNEQEEQEVLPERKRLAERSTETARPAKPNRGWATRFPSVA